MSIQYTFMCDALEDLAKALIHFGVPVHQLHSFKFLEQKAKEEMEIARCDHKRRGPAMACLDCKQSMNTVKSTPIPQEKQPVEIVTVLNLFSKLIDVIENNMKAAERKDWSLAGSAVIELENAKTMLREMRKQV